MHLISQTQGSLHPCPSSSRSLKDALSPSLVSNIKGASSPRPASNLKVVLRLRPTSNLKATSCPRPVSIKRKASQSNHVRPAFVNVRPASLIPDLKHATHSIRPTFRHMRPTSLTLEPKLAFSVRLASWSDDPSLFRPVRTPESTAFILTTFSIYFMNFCKKFVSWCLLSFYYFWLFCAFRTSQWVSRSVQMCPSMMTHLILSMVGGISLSLWLQWGKARRGNAMDQWPMGLSLDIKR